MDSAPGRAEPGREFALPVGIVTFLLTDVEGSTKAWQAAPQLMGPAIARHYAILEDAIAAHGGVRPQEQGEGDSIVGAFARASDCVAAAVAAQKALTDEPWPDGLDGGLRVRMAIHTGETQLRDEANYVGQAIIRTARLRAIAHGGQILVSQASRDLVIDQLGDRIELIDLGVHRLKDLARPEHVWQAAGEGIGRDFPPLRSLEAIPNNLPIELSSFVGRRAEIAALCALVNGNRLVTIMGAGGAGKTRLAQQVAAQITERFPDGTWWIELAQVDVSDVQSTIASILSITEPARLVERLAGRMLLVLDNCEHVLDTVAPLVHQIMSRCPDVSVLTTSRGGLDVPGEITWRVPPLPCPPEGTTLSIDRLVEFDAVRLFLDRAVRARPNFELTNRNGPTVAEICARLDGIPLAIELAAARTKSLTAEEILAGLEDALRLLTGGSRLMMARQQTLEASIGWSHNLLDESDQMLLRRLSVFADGWDLSAAEAVCSDGADLASMDVLNGLERLIDQSLIRVDERLGVARYRLMEMVRQFAARQLAQRETERGALVARHAAWFTRLAAHHGPRFEGPDEAAATSRLLPERDNLAATLRHLESYGSSVDLARLALDLTPFWLATDLGADGRTWTSVALDRLGSTEPGLRAQLHAARAGHLQVLGDMWQAVAEAQIAVELAGPLGDRRTTGRIGGLAAFGAALSDPEAALVLFDQALEDNRSVDDRFGEVYTLATMAAMFAYRGELRRQHDVLAQADLIANELGSPFARSMLSLGIATVGMFTVDHAAMRAALESLGPREIRNWGAAEGLRAHLEISLRADFGERIESPEPLVKRMLHLERVENIVGATTLKSAIVQSLRVRGEFPRSIELLTTVAPGLPPGGRSRSVGALCWLALGDVERAKAHFDSGFSPRMANVMVEIDSGIVTALFARHDGNLADAETAIHRSLALAAEHGYAREIIDAIEVLAGLAAAQGVWTDAARLAAAAQQYRENYPMKTRVEPLASMLAEDVAATTAALGDAAFRSASEEARNLTLPEIIAYAQRGRGDRNRPTIGWTSLTPTERRVADLARQGRSNAAIAADLLMGGQTVKTHLSHVYSKLGIANRTQLAALHPPPGSL